MQYRFDGNGNVVVTMHGECFERLLHDAEKGARFLAGECFATASTETRLTSAYANREQANLYAAWLDQFVTAARDD